MSGNSTVRQLTVERDAARHDRDRLKRKVTDLEAQIAVLEAKVKQLRGLGTPGLVIEALDDITAMASDMLSNSESAVVFWTAVKSWPEKLATDEREEWGELL